MASNITKGGYFIFWFCQISKTTEKIIDVTEELSRAAAELASHSHFMTQMVSSATNMKHEQSSILKALIYPFSGLSVDDSPEVSEVMCDPHDDILIQGGWEAKMEIALRDFMGPSSGDPRNTGYTTDFSRGEAGATTRLRSLVEDMLDRAFKGDFGMSPKAGSSSSSSVSPPPGGSSEKASFLHPTTAVIPEEEENEVEEDQLSEL